jgi:polyphosphate kinase 2 (PPK2 family)
VFRAIALPAPSDREKTQIYKQRYVPHFPATGEIVIFDRNSYSRVGVEYVMGFCNKEEHRSLDLCPVFENYGIQQFKFRLEVGRARWEILPTSIEWPRHSQPSARRTALSASKNYADTALCCIF